MSSNLFSVQNISRVYGSGAQAVHALKHINLQIDAGKLIALKGKSGSGKTTLLNLLGTLDRPTEGSIFFADQDLTQMTDKACSQFRKKEMGFIFQAYGLIPLMTAYENVEFGLRAAGIPRNIHRQRAEHALQFVGMHKRMQHRPLELSGGEQQRVAIARAIAHRPQFILADEPTANLDTAMSLQVLKVFRNLVAQENISIMMTTHDQAVIDVVDEVYELEDGQIVG